jgi:hypothetical protein
LRGSIFSKAKPNHFLRLMTFVVQYTTLWLAQLAFHARRAFQLTSISQKG